MNQNTVNALIARGIDSNTAQIISTNGHTLGSLKQKSKNDLINIGLTNEQADILLKEPRPPIPEDILLRVLYNSRRTCCICRDPSKSVIVHHIEEWSVSRSHAETNLVVLCLEHHDLAHTKKELSQGLSQAELIQCKNNWVASVELLDAKSILQLKGAWDYSRWDWINIPRLFELAVRQGIVCNNKDLSIYLQRAGFIESNGMLRAEGNWPVQLQNAFWFLDFGEGMYIASYLSNIVDQLLAITPIIDITPFIQSRKQLCSVISPGSFMAAQLPFYFQNIDSFEQGRSQIRRSYYRGHGIRIEYTFNAWHCLSSSARFDAMTGRKVKTIFALVTSITEEDGDLLVSISCISAGTAFATHPARSRGYV